MKTAPGNPRRRTAAGAEWWQMGLAAASGSLLLLAGCAAAANPQPPTLWLPAPVKDLTAARVNGEVHLHWTMPKNTTDHVPLKGDQRGHVCRETSAAFDPKACHAAGDGTFTPGKPADFTVKLPPELTTGTPRAVAFYVELENHAGKTAGPSNAAWVASGEAPAAATGLQLEASADGVVLHWQAAAPEPGLTMRMHRTLARGAGVRGAGVNAPGAPKPDESRGVPAPEEQTLEVDLSKADPGGAVDRDALLDHEWKYWVERVVRVQAEGHALEIAGAASDKVSLLAKDVFPPAVPAGLAVVADAQAKAMDLSWTPDSDADIAGYVVYRRDMTAGGSLERITPRTVVPPTWSDPTVTAGHRYAYAVSAVDQDGNESAKSGEVEEEMPQ
jgi:hypothetical protein